MREFVVSACTIGLSRYTLSWPTAAVFSAGDGERSACDFRALGLCETTRFPPALRDALALALFARVALALVLVLFVFGAVAELLRDALDLAESRPSNRRSASS